MRTIDNYWWCPNCHEEVDARNVTYQECHDSCGHRVQWVENIDSDRLEAICEAEKDGRCVVLFAKRGDVCFEVDEGHGVIKHVVTGYSAAEREIQYSDGVHVVSAITVETRATDDNGLEWPDHYTLEEWNEAPKTRESAEAALGGEK
jgi:hypothetical protein